MKAIERLGRIEYKAAFNRYLRRHAIRAFKQQFPNYKSYENAITSIDKAISKKATEWKYNKVSVSIGELDNPIDVMDDFMDNFITQDKIASLTAENQSLKFAASQAAQNAFITANQEAQTAELIRRLDTPCPVPAYVVPNPNCCYDYNRFGCNTCCG